MRFSSLLYLLPLFISSNAAPSPTLREIKSIFDAAKLPSDLTIDFTPTAKFFLTFPQATGEPIVLEPGMHLFRNQTIGPPIWSVRGAGEGPFVIIGLDPDAPTPLDRSEAQFRHFAGADFTTRPCSPNTHILYNSSVALTEYARPSPPAGSTAHRYTFMLFKQPPDFDDQTLLTLDTPPTNFNVSAFAEATGLGHPIAGTFMMVAPDDA